MAWESAAAGVTRAPERAAIEVLERLATEKAAAGR
jgi:hypothetical protein